MPDERINMDEWTDIEHTFYSQQNKIKHSKNIKQNKYKYKKIYFTKQNLEHNTKIIILIQVISILFVIFLKEIYGTTQMKIVIESQ